MMATKHCIIALCSLAMLCNATVIKFDNGNEKLEFDLEGEIEIDVQKTTGDKDGLEIKDAPLNCPWPPQKPAKHCDPSRCRLPKCRCSGDDIPGKIPVNQTPQMIVLSFQNAVHVTNMRLYRELFEGRKNPNQCPMTGTFFVSGQYTNFYDVQSLYAERHEIGNNGAVESTLPEYWFNANVTDWCRQISDNKKMLTTWAHIEDCDIAGFRTPYLYMGGNTQLQAYKNCGVQYDATRVAVNRQGAPNLMWPYTYDYQSMQDCTIGRCANASFPGIWQVPLEALPDPRNVPCAELQGCYLDNKREVFNMLFEAFKERYNNKTGNRAPMMISISTAFLLTDYKFNGLAQFMDVVSRYDDVFFVTAKQVLDWVKKPESIKPCHCKHKHYPAAFNCSQPAPKVCTRPRTCYYDNNRRFVPGGAQGAIYVLTACMDRCPGCYPTLGDPLGSNC